MGFYLNPPSDVEPHLHKIGGIPGSLKFIEEVSRLHKNNPDGDGQQLESLLVVFRAFREFAPGVGFPFVAVIYSEDECKEFAAQMPYLKGATFAVIKAEEALKFMEPGSASRVHDFIAYARSVGA